MNAAQYLLVIEWHTRAILFDNHKTSRLLNSLIAREPRVARYALSTTTNSSGTKESSGASWRHRRFGPTFGGVGIDTAAELGRAYEGLIAASSSSSRKSGGGVENYATRHGFEVVN